MRTNYIVERQESEWRKHEDNSCPQNLAKQEYSEFCLEPEFSCTIKGFPDSVINNRQYA